MKITCLIPARSGSKRIKNKNIINFKGTNLLNFVFKRIIKSKLINHFVLASDNPLFYSKLQSLNLTKIRKSVEKEKNLKGKESTENFLN